MKPSPSPLMDGKAARAARLLMEQHLTGAAFDDLPANLMPDGLDGPDGAYAVQDALVALRRAHYCTEVAGYKIALTSKPMQALCGIDQPLAGTVLSDAVQENGAVMVLDEHMHAGIEFELCVVLGEDLPADQAPFTGASVGVAVAECIPSFEIIEDRGADYDALNAAMLAADNSWNHGVVMGMATDDWRRLDLCETPVRLLIDGEVAGETVTGAAMGHPFEAVAWIANNLATRGQSLRAGQFIMTGSTLPTRFPDTESAIRYEIEGLGAVEMTTIGSARPV